MFVDRLAWIECRSHSVLALEIVLGTTVVATRTREMGKRAKKKRTTNQRVIGVVMLTGTLANVEIREMNCCSARWKGTLMLMEEIVIEVEIGVVAADVAVDVDL